MQLLTSNELKWSATLCKNVAEVWLMPYIGSCGICTWLLHNWISSHGLNFLDRNDLPTFPLEPYTLYTFHFMYLRMIFYDKEYHKSLCPLCIQNLEKIKRYIFTLIFCKIKGIVCFYFIFDYITIFHTKITTNFYKCRIMQLLQCILDKETCFR